MFELPGFRRLTYISLPCFYLHHVLPTPSGILIVVVTGLDMVVLVDSHSLISPWAFLQLRANLGSAMQ